MKDTRSCFSKKQNFMFKSYRENILIELMNQIEFFVSLNVF